MDLEELVRQAFQGTRTPTLVVLDGIQDPGNLGAIIRSAEVLGIQGIILPRYRSASLNETVAKCSSGAIETLSFTWAANLARALDRLKKAGFWIVGVEPGGRTPCYGFEFNLPVALVVGGEEKGIRPLLRKKCDFSVSIPIQGALSSLNASAACAVVFYEILRQKKTGAGAGCGNGREPVISEKKRPEIS